jgi:hypothetical protein
MFEERQSVAQIAYVVAEQRDSAVSCSGMPREEESQIEHIQLFINNFRSPCRDTGNNVMSNFEERCFIERVLGLSAISA